MRRLSSGLSRVVAALALLIGGAGRAGAGPLNPLDFASLGAFPTAGGTYYFDTDGPNPTLGAIGGPPLTGVVFNGIAVFDFNAITVSSSQTFVGMGSLPVAFLSRSDITIDGTIGVSAPLVSRSFSPGGPGGFGSDSGPGAGQFGGTVAYAVSFSNPGGGGFGGAGGNGGAGYSVPGPPPVLQFVLVPFGGGKGGSSYGNLAASLQGGSGGGSYSTRAGISYGGGGGGAIEVGAIGRISVGGSILANGASGSLDGGGGGSGGGIFLHGDSVTLTSSGVLSAQGGNGSGNGGGGGGGGRVLIEVGTGGFSGDVSSINVSGGGGGGGGVFPPYPPLTGPFDADGAPGVFGINVVPEPASLVLLGIGLLGVLGCARFAGRRAAA
jgi:hypothetical protein